ncbi:MAG: sensor histidine kinase [Lachnospira sp.]|nr:sensor histidine kinase [Lachnospira sp.]
MKDLVGKIIVLLYCVFSLMFVSLDGIWVVGLFCIVAAGCLVYVYHDKRVACDLILGIYLILVWIFPHMCFFLPAVGYDAVRGKRWHMGAAAAAVAVVRILPQSKIQLLYILFGGAIAVMIAWQTSKVLDLEEQLKKIRDDSTEKNILLEEKNRSLIEKQNQDIYTATLKERNRIAREIHDHVGHMLSRSILLVAAMKAINSQENMDTTLNQLEDTLHQAMNNVRASVHDLHDESVDLRASIEEIIGGFTKCRCELDYDCGRDIPNEVKFSCIAIVKEALANVMKHSDATHVYIRLREHPGLYQFVIDDNGTTARQGRYESIGESVQDGMGLSNMRERVHALGGNIQIEMKKGFHIFVTIPKGKE